MIGSPVVLRGHEPGKSGNVVRSVASAEHSQPGQEVLGSRVAAGAWAGRATSRLPSRPPARSRPPPIPSTRRRCAGGAERDLVSGVRDTAAQSRQAGATWHGGRLSQLRVPALVVHGAEDPLLRPAAAGRTAAAISGARLVILPGVGPYLPAAVYPQVAGEVRALADRAAPSQAGLTAHPCPRAPASRPAPG
jgi:pimeloyl-ACP methyl ester carboxylesterase